MFPGVCAISHVWLGFGVVGRATQNLLRMSSHRYRKLCMRAVPTEMIYFIQSSPSPSASFSPSHVDHCVPFPRVQHGAVNIYMVTAS